LLTTSDYQGLITELSTKQVEVLSLTSWKADTYA